VPIIFDAGVTGEPTDRFKPLVPPHRGCRLSGPIDRGLGADVCFLSLGGKAGEAANRYSAFAISKPAVRRKASQSATASFMTAPPATAARCLSAN
jgi:hypothetical protein